MNRLAGSFYVPEFEGLRVLMPLNKYGKRFRHMNLAMVKA